MSSKNYLLGAALSIGISSVLHVISGDDKWFSRFCLAALFFCTYSIVEAIENKN
jgi:hypothetical protein